MNNLELARRCYDLRMDVVRMIREGKGGHIGGDMSIMETMAVLYLDEMNVDPSRADDPDRDRFVLSKGHCVETYYAVLAAKGFLDIEEDDYVLDLCSAPGGKATQLACKLNNTGILVSNDISASRQNATLRNIERFGITDSFVISDDPEHLAEKWPASFDKVLVDAPCSGEGMFRKDPSLIKAWLERGNEYYAICRRE